MKRYRRKIGVTLLEMLIVVAVVALLVSVTVGVATRINNQAREQLVRNSFALLDAALEQFHDYGYSYDHAGYGSLAERNFYRGLDFPVDCNGFTQTVLEDRLALVLGLNPGDVSITGGTHQAAYSGSEALYFFLSRVPECRKTLDKIDASLITNLGSDRQPMSITIDGRTYPLLRIVDPWGVDPLRRSLHYDYYNEWALTLPDMELSRRNFPLIISDGPDRKFDTADDLTNR